MKASIVIPYKKEQKPIQLLSFLKQYQENADVVTDNIEGISKARNNCLKKATGEIIIFLDADCFPITSDWLPTIIVNTQKYGVVVGKIVQQTNNNFIQNYIAYKNGFGGTFTPPYTAVTPISKKEFSPMTNVGIKRDILNQIGEFDEKLFAGEDIDFMFRLKRDNKVYYIPNMAIEHKNSESISSFLLKVYKRRKRYLNNSKILRRKHNYSIHYTDAKRKMLLTPIFALLLITVPFVYLFNKFRAFDFIVYFIESIAEWRGLI